MLDLAEVPALTGHMHGRLMWMPVGLEVACSVVCDDDDGG